MCPPLRLCGSIRKKPTVCIRRGSLSIPKCGHDKKVGRKVSKHPARPSSKTTPDPSKICVKHTSLKSKIPTPDVTMANFKTPISPRFPTTTRWHFGFVFFFFCCEHYVSVCFLLRTQCSAISASCFLCSVYVRAHTWANILDLTFRNCSLFWSHASLYFSENRAIETCQSHCCGNVQKTSKNKFENCSPGSQGRGHGLFSLKAFIFGGGRSVTEIEIQLIHGKFRYIP